MDENEIEDFVTNIQDKNFTAAEANFNNAISSRIDTALDQAKVRVASQIYNDVDVESEEEDLETED